MPSQISLHIEGYLQHFKRFRAAYFVAREKMLTRGIKDLNLAEFAVLHSRGGRRVPLWLRATAEHSDTPAECVITKHDLRDFYDHLFELISKHRIVPKTKIETLATYLVGQVCARVSTLSDFAGIGTSTARNWLRLCAEHQLLEPFRTAHESFFLNMRLIELVIDGRSSESQFFAAQFGSDLEILRRRKDWMAESPIASFYGYPVDLFQLQN
jgi:hypothetical protein